MGPLQLLLCHCFLGILSCLLCEPFKRLSRRRKEVASCRGLLWLLEDGIRPLLSANIWRKLGQPLLDLSLPPVFATISAAAFCSQPSSFRTISLARLSSPRGDLAVRLGLRPTTKKVPFSAKAAFHVRVRQRLQILPPEEGVPWSGQKGKRDPAACEDDENAPEKPVAVLASVGGSGKLSLREKAAAGRCAIVNSRSFHTQ